MAASFLAFLLLLGCAGTGGGGGDELVLESFAREDAGAAVGVASATRWTARVRGGTGPLRYEFRSLRGSVEIVEQEGTSATWLWRPHTSGTFRVKVEVRDASGRKVDSGWSEPIAVSMLLGEDALIAVLPVENLTGTGAPLRAVLDRLRGALGRLGARLVDEDRIAEFMEHHRMRNTGGLSSSISQAVRDEIGADAVLLTSLQTYREPDPPRVAALSRLVLSGREPTVLWMDGAALAGDAYPGFLNLGLRHDPDELLDGVVDCLMRSLSSSLRASAEASDSADENAYPACDRRGRVAWWSAERSADRKHRPSIVFRSPAVATDRRYSMAVVPFLNLSDRKHAGQIVALHFVSQLLKSRNFRVVEPGLVREELLRYRIIMPAGPSVANVEVLSSARALDVDLILSGTVFDYQDAINIPKVDFAVKIIEAKSRTMVWSSRSASRGDEGVLFFDIGRIYTAHTLASALAWGTFDAFIP